MSLRNTRFLALTFSALALAGCAGGTQVARIETAQIADISGNWNDTDSRLVADSLIDQAFDDGWIEEYMKANQGKRPVVLLTEVTNQTAEHIDTETFINDLARALRSSRTVDVQRGGARREGRNAEVARQQGAASAATRLKTANATGARFALEGTIKAIEDREGGKAVKFYQIDVIIIDMETENTAWEGQRKIKKFVQKSRLKS